MEWAVLASDHSTKGGSRETELKLLAVTPTGLLSESMVVTIVTPVANCPSAFRKAMASVTSNFHMRKNHSPNLRKIVFKSKNDMEMRIKYAILFAI